MVKLHRAVMSVVLDRQLGSNEFVYHRADDQASNWIENIYLGDVLSNAADRARNGGLLYGDLHPFTKIPADQVREPVSDTPSIVWSPLAFIPKESHHSELAP